MSPRNDLEEALLALGKTMGMDSETIDRVGVPFLLGAAVERLRQINRGPGEWFIEKPVNHEAERASAARAEDFERLRRDRDELRKALSAARIERDEAKIARHDAAARIVGLERDIDESVRDRAEIDRLRAAIAAHKASPPGSGDDKSLWAVLDPPPKPIVYCPHEGCRDTPAEGDAYCAAHADDGIPF